MTTENVQPDEQPDHFAELAAELHKVADDIAAMVGSGLPKPRLFQLNIQPGTHADDDDLTARAVDAMAQALLGITGKVERMSSGTYFYNTDHLKRGPLEIAIYQGVSTEWALKNDVAAAKAELAKREAELEKMRAEVATLRASRRPPVSPEKITEAHVAALFEDGQRAKVAVVADLRAGEDGRVTNPNLAQFLAGKEHKRRQAAHFLGLEESAKHYPASDPSGLAYTRADTDTDTDDPTPVSPARVPLHTGSVVADGVLVTDVDGCE